jgi:site-specific DNA-cytosine methylase
MRILIACEESQAVTKEFRKLGHEAYSCDIQECSGGHPEWHIIGDVLKELNKKWDMIIAFPPCTHLSSSGQWAYNKGKDTKLREEAVDFFMAFANADCDKIAIENPVGIISSRWRKPNQIVQPWHFGDMASKQTCLWLKGLPKLVPSITEKPEFEYHEWVDNRTGKKKRMEKWMYNIRTKPQKERSKLASKTFPGIARAMALQWTQEANIYNQGGLFDNTDVHHNNKTT